MAVFLISLAGVPPTAGFLAKYFVFYSAMVGNQVPLAIVGILASVLGMFYYLRVIWAMYFVGAEPTPGSEPIREPALAVVGVAANGFGASGESASEQRALTVSAHPVTVPSRVRVPFGSAVALVVAVALTLLMMLIASPLDTYAQSAAAALFR